MAGQVLTTQQVCDRYSVSRSTIERMREVGKLVFGMAGNSYRYSQEECDRAFLGIEPKNEEAA